MDESVYDYIYPAGSFLPRLYGTPKIHKIKEKSDISPLRPIVSSINSYNYNLASYLCELLALYNALHKIAVNPVDIYMFKVNNRNTRTRCEICSKVTIKTPERRHWRCSGVSIVNFENI